MLIFILFHVRHFFKEKKICYSSKPFCLPAMVNVINLNNRNTLCKDNNNTREANTHTDFFMGNVDHAVTDINPNIIKINKYHR